MKEGKLVKNFFLAAFATFSLLFLSLVALSWVGKYPEFLESRKQDARSAELLLQQPVCTDTKLVNQLGSSQRKECERALYRAEASPYYLALLDVSNDICSNNSRCNQWMNIMVHNLYGTVLFSLVIIGILLYFGVLGFTQRFDDQKLQKYFLPTTIRSKVE